MAQRNEAEMAASNYQRPEGADGIISNLREGDFSNAGKSLAYGVAEAAPQVAGGAAASIGAGLAATSAPIIGTGLAVAGTAYGVTNALGPTGREKAEQGIDPTATATDLASAVASGLVRTYASQGRWCYTEVPTRRRTRRRTRGLGNRWYCCPRWRVCTAGSY